MRCQVFLATVRLAPLAVVACLMVPPAATGQGWWPSKPSDGAVEPASATQPAFGAVPAPPAMPASQPTTPANAAADAPLADGENKWMITSPFANIGWPEIKMPEMNWKPWGGGQPADPKASASGPLTTVRNMTQSAAQRTRSAWNSTVERFKFTGGAQRPAPGRDEPGFFARMFGGAEPEGPQTVPEFLAQERPGSVR